MNHSSRSWGTPLLVVLFLLGACAPYAVPPPAGPTLTAASCRGKGKGNPDYYAPMVCVDNTSELLLSVNREPVHAIRKDSNGVPIRVTWQTVRAKPAYPQDMVITVADGCLAAQPTCNNQGLCYADTKVDAAAGTTCKYTITFTERGWKLDPVVVIDDCCPPPPPPPDDEGTPQQKP